MVPSWGARFSKRADYEKPSLMVARLGQVFGGIDLPIVIPCKRVASMFVDRLAGALQFTDVVHLPIPVATASGMKVGRFRHESVDGRER